jgi:signal transduction histidine kinase
LGKATTFSYLCLFFGIIFSIALTAYNLLTRPESLRFNLNQKIQLLLVSLTLLTMVLFALATRYYIEAKYTEKNERLISEKMQSVLQELESKLGEEEQLSYDIGEYINRLLSRFSYIFFTDINLYSPEGNLIGSSQMRMFNEGLLSRKMHPDAYAHMNYLKEVEFIQEEYVGNLNYLSVYAPFYGVDGELLGYANLPYFARQTELTQEISNFLIAVVNLFVLLFVLSIVIGLFVSQWITLPLRSLRESLAAIELGKASRLIGYSGKDEIGLLVEEYNAKVAELEMNAERLARSERESAWREMAKQVAHEIKNPLTPMKLSVQHLQRNLLQEGEVDRERIQKLTNNLVDQIDSLSAIASAFSNFARMPQAHKEIVNLKDLIQKTMDLFDGFDKIEFETKILVEGTAEIEADRDQILRVMNNLVKNAVQSIPAEQKGKIEVVLKRENDGFRCDVKDNGIGISANQRDKIFVPNFTTKSRGMGLGLAMSKNMVEQSGGKIWFESKPGQGSVFSIWFPSIR